MGDALDPKLAGGPPPLDPPAAAGPPPLDVPAAAVEAAVAPELKVEPGPLARLSQEQAAKVEAPKAEAEKPDAEKAVEKPKDAAPPEAPKPEAPAAEVPPAPAAPEPVEWKFDLPETMRADEPRMAKFTGILDDLLAPKEGQNRVEVAQQLIGLHEEAMRAFEVQMTANQFKVYNETGREWEKRQMADPEFGGSAYPLALSACARARDHLLTTQRPGDRYYDKAKHDSDLREWDEMLQSTGVDKHPAFMRLLHNAAAYVDEPQAASIPVQIRPPKNIGKPPGKPGDDLYDNPRSPRSDR